MTLTLDHYFILTDDVTVAGDRLCDFGIEEIESRVHPGQGTANRRFVFENGPLLELLYVHDVNEALHGVAKDLNFYQRQNSDKASPFGLVFRQQEMLHKIKPFPGWTYQPEYFAPPTAFHVADNSENLTEPLCICMPFPVENHNKSVDENETRVEKICLTIPVENFSKTLLDIGHTHSSSVLLDFVLGKEHLIEVFITNSPKSSNLPMPKSEDLRPLLPLILWY